MSGDAPDDEGPDPADELARLARGLRSQVKRRQRLGGHRPAAVRAADAAPATESRGASPAPTAPAPTAPAATRARATPRAPEFEPSAPGPRGSTSGPARSAADVRAQAAAAQTLDELRAGVARCEACGLCKTRTNTVFLDGRGARRVLFVGEAPGADEDRTGVPFVGRAGQLLTDIITKGMGIDRQEVWIANVLKCRPPENRDPTPEEKATCTPWLDRQIELLQPAILIPLGRHAAMHVLQVQAPMSALRGRVHEVRGRPVVPTFHPAYLLRSPGEKKECWKDIQLAMGVVGLAPPKRGTGS